MAINYKSKQQTITNTIENTLLTPGSGIDTVIVNSIVCKFQSGSVLTTVELKISKYDDNVTKSFFQATFGDTTAETNPADYPANKAAECLTSPIVLEDGDELIAEISGGGFTFFLQYAERTTAAATGDIENLSNVSTDAPSNNDVLIYNSVSGQYEPGSVSSVGTGAITGTNGLTEESPNRFMKRLDLLDDLSVSNAALENPEYLQGNPDTLFLTQENGNNAVRKITFEDMMAAIVQTGVDALVNAGYGTTSTYTADGSATTGDLDGDGSVSTQDLLIFLTSFGSIINDVLYNFNKTVFRHTSGGQRDLIDRDVFYDMMPTTSSADTTGSQNVTIDGTNGAVRITQNQVDFAAQGGFKIIVEKDDPDNDDGLQVTIKEDGTVLQFWIQIQAFEDSTLVDTYTAKFHEHIYNVGGAFAPAAVGDIIAQFTSENYSKLDDQDVTAYRIKFLAKRTSANSQYPRVRFDNLKVTFKKNN